MTTSPAAERAGTHAVPARTFTAVKCPGMSLRMKGV